MSKQLGIKEIINFSISKFDTGEPVAYVDYASNSSISTDAERLDLRGGQGNYKLLSFDHTKNCTMAVEMPLVDLNFLSQLTGEDIITGSANVPRRQILTTNASNQVTLAATPVSGTLKVYLLDGSYGDVLGRDYGTQQVAGTPASQQNTYSIAGAVITLNATTAPQGTKVICEYDYASAATTRTITFRADRFVGYFNLNGWGLVTDQVTGEQREVIFDIKKAKPKNNFTITMKSTEATVLSMEFDLYTVDVLGNDGNIQKVYLTMHDMD